MPKMSRGWVLAICLMVGAPFAVAKPKAAFMADVQAMYEIGKSAYCYFDEKKASDGADWEAAYAAAKQAMANVQSPNQYYAVLRTFAAALHDGHVNAMIADPGTLVRYYVPVRFADVEGTILVSSVKQALLDDPQSIVPGDVVVAMDGVPIEQVIQSRLAMVSGSTAGMRRATAMWLLNMYPLASDVPTDNMHLTIQHAGETMSHTVALPWRVVTGPQAAAAAWDPATTVYARILPGNIGYLYLGAMMPVDDKVLSDEQYRDYVTAQFRSLQNTRAMIIDLRDNGGGDPDVGYGIIAHLIDQPLVANRLRPRLSPAILAQRPWYLLEALQDTQHDGWGVWTDQMIDPVPAERRYHGSVTALIGPDCFSACDIFADALSAHHLAKMVGAPTGGGSGLPIAYDLPSYQAKVRFSTAQRESMAGRLIEGHGTQPDVALQASVADVQSGIDVVLRQTYQQLRSASGKGAMTSDDESIGNEFFTRRSVPVVPGDWLEMQAQQLSAHEGEELAR